MSRRLDRLPVGIADHGGSCLQLCSKPWLQQGGRHGVCCEAVQVDHVEGSINCNMHCMGWPWEVCLIDKGYKTDFCFIRSGQRSASGLSTVCGFALHRMKEYKWWCMYTFFPEGESVLTAGSGIKKVQGKLTTRLSAATRPNGSLATEQGPVMGANVDST